MAGPAQAIVEAAMMEDPAAAAAAAAAASSSASSSLDQAAPPSLLVLLGTLLLAVVLGVVPMLVEVRREAKRVASEEARALEAVRKRLTGEPLQEEEEDEPHSAAAAAAAAEEAAAAAASTDDDEALDDSAASSIGTEAESLDPVLARQQRLDALARRRPTEAPPATQQAQPKPSPTTAAAGATAAIPDNPLSPGAVETAVRFPFLQEWKQEARAALRAALKAEPRPPQELRVRLRRLLAHILENPHDPRFRSFRRGNPAFASLWGCGGGTGAPGPFHALLWKLGFKEEGSGGKGMDGDNNDDDVVVSLATAPTAAHLEVIRALVASLNAIDPPLPPSSSPSVSLPQPPPLAEGWDAGAEAGAGDGGGGGGWGRNWGDGGWGGMGTGGWRRSAPVPRDRRPGRGPWG